MSNKFISWAIFILLCFIWGSSFKLMKDSAALPASQIAALRIFAGGIVFVPFAIFHFSKIPRRKLGMVILIAITGNLFPAFLFAKALLKIDGSLGGILNSLTPICVVVVGILFFNTRVSAPKLAGVITGFLGLALLILFPVLSGEKTIRFSNFEYALLILLATFLYGINVNLVSKHLIGLNPIHVATVSLASMTLPTAIVLGVQGFHQLDFSDPGIRYAVWASVGLGILGSAVATALFYVLVQRAGGLFASLVTYGIPFIALFWGFVDGEKISWVQVGCLGIILLGVYLANRPEKKQAKPSDFA
jgi:drug/metabolite transporter (DMT)-like permease